MNHALICLPVKEPERIWLPRSSCLPANSVIPYSIFLVRLLDQTVRRHVLANAGGAVRPTAHNHRESVANIGQGYGQLDPR
jgi:hypothetical protein